MTNDPTRNPDPGLPVQTAEPWYAAPATGAGETPASPFIPQGIVAKATATASKGGGILTAALVAAALIAALGVGFAVGRVTSQQQATGTRGQGFGNGNGVPNASGRPGNGGFGAFASGTISISGSVVALGNGSITVQPAGGTGTVQIAVPGTATYHSQGSATSTDVAIGSQVQVTVTRPQFRGGPDASGAPGAAGPGAGGAASLTATDILLTGK